MKNHVRRMGQAGFTLIEVLVTLILIAVLAAAVFPVISQQAQQADAPRAANDLASIRTAIEVFNVNVKRQYPGDLEDLVYQISTTDLSIKGDAYKENPDTRRWDGPYLDIAVTEGTVMTGDAFITGFDGLVQNDLVLFDAGDALGGNGATATTATADFVAAKIVGLTSDDFVKLNTLLDGESDSGTASLGKQSGKLRCPGATCAGETGSSLLTDPVFYLAVPFRN